MTIFCKICGQKLNSTRPDAEQQKDVLTQMSNHIGSHQEQAVTLAKSIVQGSQLLATYLLLKKYVRIPPEEKELQISFQENEKILIEIFGLEPAEKETAN